MLKTFCMLRSVTGVTPTCRLLAEKEKDESIYFTKARVPIHLSKTFSYVKRVSFERSGRAQRAERDAESNVF